MLRDVARAEAHDADYARGIARLEMAGLTVLRVADPTGQDGRSRDQGRRRPRPGTWARGAARADRCRRGGRTIGRGRGPEDRGDRRRGGARSGAARGGQGAGRRGQGARREGPETPAQERGQGARGRGRVGTHRDDQPAAALRGGASRVQDPRRHGARARASTSRIPGPDGSTSLAWICSLLEVVGLNRSTDSEDWGILLRITDSDQVVHEWPMPASLLAGRGDEMRAELLGLGPPDQPDQDGPGSPLRVHPDLAHRSPLPLRRSPRLARRHVRAAAAGLRTRDVRRRGAVPAPARAGHPKVRAGRHDRGLARGGRGAGARQRSSDPRARHRVRRAAGAPDRRGIRGPAPLRPVEHGQDHGAALRLLGVGHPACVMARERQCARAGGRRRLRWTAAARRDRPGGAPGAGRRRLHAGGPDGQGADEPGGQPQPGDPALDAAVPEHR